MIYGDTAHAGVPYWLTTGATGIVLWRNGRAKAGKVQFKDHFAKK